MAPDPGLAKLASGRVAWTGFDQSVAVGVSDPPRLSRVESLLTAVRAAWAPCERVRTRRVPLRGGRQGERGAHRPERGLARPLDVDGGRFGQHHHLDPRASSHAKVSRPVAALQLFVGGLDPAPRLVVLPEGRLPLLPLPGRSRGLAVSPSQDAVGVSLLLYGRTAAEQRAASARVPIECGLVRLAALVIDLIGDRDLLTGAMIESRSGHLPRLAGRGPPPGLAEHSSLQLGPATALGVRSQVQDPLGVRLQPRDARALEAQVDHPPHR